MPGYRSRGSLLLPSFLPSSSSRPDIFSRSLPLLSLSSLARPQVDFAVPKGYVEPKAPEPKPVSTMASKLNIDVNSTVPSRAGSATGGGGDTSGDGEAAFEAFVGGGRTLNGRRTKGKGLARKIEEVEKDSKIQRTE